MPLSNTTAVSVLNDLYRDEAIYLALYTSNPTGADTGTEVSGGAYARQAITFAAPALDGGKQTVKTSTTITFPVATGDWGTITHIGIRSAATGGSLISFAALDTPRTILAGDRFLIEMNNGIVRLS